MYYFLVWWLKWRQNPSAIDLAEILDDNLPENQQIDFLSIDVEGLDFMVLKSNNFDKYKPKIILIEILGRAIADIANGEISEFLKTYNYSFYARSVRTAFFVHNENVKDLV